MEKDQPIPSNESETSEIMEDSQKKKLLLEIKQLERSWIKHICYSPAFLPTVFALSALLVGVYTGLFDVKKEKLQLDIAKFEVEKSKIIEESTSLKAERDSLVKLNARLKIQKDSLTRFASEAIIRLNRVDQLVAKIPKNYVLSDENGKPLMTEDGKFIATEEDPVIRQLRIEMRALQKIFDKSFDDTFN